MLFTVFFSLDGWQLGLVIFAIVGGACVVGVLLGRYLRRHSEHYREGIGALQGALLGVVGLILAFGLTLAVGRYQDRRADVVTDANTIGTAHLRAPTIALPQGPAARRAPARTLAAAAPGLQRPGDPRHRPRARQRGHAHDRGSTGAD